VHYWADLQLVHGLRCYGNIMEMRSSNPPRPLHALRMLAKTPLASDKIDTPAASVTLSATRPLHFVHIAGVL